jgi:hypothetical protein
MHKSARQAQGWQTEENIYGPHRTIRVRNTTEARS